MLLRRLSLFATTLLVGHAVHAFTPESGGWSNPAEPGTAYTIDIQRNYLALSVYTYTATGSPNWFISVGQMSGNTAYSGTMDGFVGGACPSCSYVAPTPVRGAGGPISITFTTETTADLTWGGRTVQIQRINFTGDREEMMLGEWQAVIDLHNYPSQARRDYPFFGDLLIFDRVDRAANPDIFLGCRPTDSIVGRCTTTSSSLHDAAGRYSSTTSGHTHIFVVTDVPATATTSPVFLFYYVAAGLTQFDGVVEMQNSGTAAGTGPFYPVRGFRTASSTFVQTGIGPNATDKSASAKEQPRQGLSELLGAGKSGARGGGLSAEQVQAKFGIDVRSLAPQAEQLVRALPQ